MTRKKYTERQAEIMSVCIRKNKVSYRISFENIWIIVFVRDNIVWEQKSALISVGETG